MELKNQKVIIVGGSSGIGMGIAKGVVAKGAQVIIASRSEERLRKAAKEIGKNVEFRVLDASKPDKVKAFFDKIDRFDHLVTTTHDASPAVLGGVLRTWDATDLEAARQFYESKFWAQVLAVKYGVPKLSSHGSVTMMAGIASKRTVSNHVFASAINGAVGAFGSRLAQEIGPKRINVISAGLIDTPTYDLFPEADRKGFFKLFEEILPVKRYGTVEDIAHSAIYLMENGYVTGTVMVVDGGYEVAIRGA